MAEMVDMTTPRGSRGVSLGRDYRFIITRCPVLIDLRAPVEYLAGSLPKALNLPLLDDQQRHHVGTCYRQAGREKALQLAAALVSGAQKAQRIERWVHLIAEHPGAMIFCFRGGLRSQVAQQWIYQESGVETRRIEGGYKALRNYILRYFASYQPRYQPVILGGHTGSGKTEMIRSLPWSIDLEALAHHRGSAFGSYATPQPSQAGFENHLAAALITYDERAYPLMVVEDEGKHIGQRFLPRTISSCFAKAPLVLVEEPLPQRLERIFFEYVTLGQRSFIAQHGNDQGVGLWCALMKDNCRKIAKRLGARRLNDLLSILERAEHEQKRTGLAESHRLWLELLITNYYDPMYDYQLCHTEKSILFQGDKTAVLEYLHFLATNTRGL